MAKRVDLKAKQKRQKIVAAGGGVILLGVLVIQGPKTWALLHAKAPAEPPPTAAPAPGTPVPLAPPTTAGGAPSGSATSGQLIDSDPAPVPTQNQLLSFSRFVTKDPFVAQVDTKGGAAATPTPAPSAKPSSPGSPLVPAPNGSGSKTTPTPSKEDQPTPAKPTTATISVNGVSESISVDKDFPTAEPIFRLVSLTRRSAKISIAGGSFASGKPTITLELGKTVTLMNTADGTRYEIRLISIP